MRGSSPLTRGKPEARSYRQPSRRLIPAHAGKTAGPRRPAHGSGAHPRSRGENTSCEATAIAVNGSSPLTRGKLRDQETQRVGGGLIPAHAGKTTRAACRPRGTRAHPRSRGENARPRCGARDPVGSSPLTRGKLVGRQSFACVLRLIPAHAGKTPRNRRSCRCRRAHPRSRGENSIPPVTRAAWRGSSPLTRGKHALVGAGAGGVRLIPAHAGKTVVADLDGAPTAAHPRSRGENGLDCVKLRVRLGSSPLTRGKRRSRAGLASSLRLIPAHAGKTAQRHATPF